MHKDAFDALESMVRKHCKKDDKDCFYSDGDADYYHAINALVKQNRMKLWMVSGIYIKAKFRSDCEVKKNEKKELTIRLVPGTTMGSGPQPVVVEKRV